MATICDSCGFFKRRADKGWRTKGGYTYCDRCLKLYSGDAMVDALELAANIARAASYKGD